MNGRWYAAVGVGFAGAALVASLTGAADGAVQAPTAAGKGVTKTQATAIAKKQANKAITARAPGLTVGTAKKAAPTGVAGGNLTGTYPNPIVALGAITTPRLAAAAVTSGKLADGSVTTGKLAAQSVTHKILASGSVTSEKLATQAVTTAGLADGSVTEAKLGGQIVAARNLVDGAVTAQALGSVTIVSGDGRSVLAGESGAATIVCPEPSRILSGGGAASDVFMTLVSSYPQSESSWRVVYHNGGGSTAFFSPMASCLDATGG